MARWKLLEKHYLTVEGTTYELREIDRFTGRQVKRVFKVPRLLDPDDPNDWTNVLVPREVGEVIVCQPGKGQPSDIPFIGDPTPNMEPLDEEAKAISASFAKKWKFDPFAAADGITHSQQIELQMHEQQAKKTVEADTKVSKLEALVEQMLESNAKLQARILELEDRTSMPSAPPPSASATATTRRL